MKQDAHHRQFRRKRARAHQRPIILYNQAACWVALGVISIDEAADLYPEKITYILDLSELFRRIEKENDLEWAFPEAKRIYLRMVTEGF